MGTEIAERGPTDVEVAQKNAKWDFEQAEKYKLHGNECYRNGKYMEALAKYSEAINLMPTTASYYGNRAATYMMLHRFHEALQDARQSVHLDSTFVRGYQREAKCLLSIGDAYAALQSYRKVLELESDNESALAEISAAEKVLSMETEARQDYEKGDFRRAVYCMNQCLEQAPTATKYKLLKAECLAFIGQYQEAQEIANSVVTVDSTNVDALFVRGLCMYYEDHVEKAQQHFREVLRLCPDHTKAKDAFRKTKQLSSKKEDGNSAFKSGRYEEACVLYTDALTVDQLNKAVNAKLFCNRAVAFMKLRRLPECLDDCSKALEADPGYMKAYLRRAKCYMEMGKYEEAVRDYETANNKDGGRDPDIKQLLQEAKFELKKSKRKDYYKILGVSKDASEDVIKKAYKKRALIHHPDRHSHDTPEKQRDEELKFKELGEAYAVLSDPKKKARFDSGQDMDDMMSGPGDIDPNMIFQMFFGGGGASGGMEDMMFGGGIPRGHRHHGRRGGGFPGGAPSGFAFQF